MRIIKKGKIPLPKEKIKVCWNCNTEMAYVKDDYFLDINYDKYIICPVCRQRLNPSIFDKKVKR